MDLGDNASRKKVTWFLRWAFLAMLCFNSPATNAVAAGVGISAEPRPSGTGAKSAETQPGGKLTEKTDKAASLALAPSCAFPICYGKETESKPGFWGNSGPVLLESIPTLLWVLFGGFAVWYLSPQLIGLIGRLKSFKGGGIELEFTIDRRIEQAAEQQSVAVPRARRMALRKRIALVGSAAQKMRILWVDDFPNNNTYEKELLFDLGADVAEASTTDAAIAVMYTHAYDLVISDMARGADKTAGLTLVTRIHDAQFKTPIIIYTGTDQSGLPRPGGLFGITNRPDELVHLLLDVRERHLP